MKTNGTIRKVLYLIIVLSVILGGCDIVIPQKTTETPTPSATPTETMTPTVVPSPTFTPPLPPTEALPTETVTPMPMVVMDTPTKTVSSAGRCYGLNGRLEVRVLTPDAGQFGITSVSVGEIPFYVTTEFEPYRIQGKSKLIYKDKIEDEDVGTLKVNTDLMGTVNGQCVAGDNGTELRLNVTISGSQLVVVRSKGFNKQIPWSGGENMNMTFGLSNGYSVPGGEWLFVLWKGIEENQPIATADVEEDD